MLRMSCKKKTNDYGTGIPHHEVEALARLLLPEIQNFFESEEGQQEYRAWKAQKKDLVSIVKREIQKF